MPNLIDEQGKAVPNSEVSMDPRAVSLKGREVDLSKKPDPVVPTQGQGQGQGQEPATVSKPLSTSEQMDAYVRNHSSSLSTKIYGENYGEKYGGAMSGIDDASITPSQESDVASIMSERQSGYQQGFNALVGGATKGVLGVGQSVGLLGKLFSSDDWETGALYDTMTQARDNVDEAMPIFTDPKKFSWDSSMFWSLTSGLVDNAVQFGVVGAGVGIVLGAAGRAVNFTAKELGALEALEKLADGSAKGQKAAGYINALKDNAQFIKALNSVPAGIIMNDIEGTMEGLDNYKQVYQEYKDQGFNDEEATKAATASAAKTKNLNRLLVLQDIFALHGILGSKDKFTDAILNEPRLFKRWSELKKGANPFNPAFWDDFTESQVFNMLGEGAEELTQGVISEEASRSAKMKTNKAKPGSFDVDEGDFGTRLKSYLSDDEILYQGLAGAYGGGAQRWAANSAAVVGDKMAYRKINSQLSSLKEQLKTATDPGQKAELENQIEIKQKDLESTWKGKYDTQQEMIKENQQLKSSFGAIANGFDLYDKAVIDGDEVSQELLSDNLFTNSVVKNLRRGTIQSFQQQLQDIVDGNVDPEVKSSLGEDHAKKAQDMLDMTKKMRKDYIQSQSYLAAEEVFFLNQNISNTRKAYDTAEKKEQESKQKLKDFSKGLFDFPVIKSTRDGEEVHMAHDLFDIDNMNKKHVFGEEENQKNWDSAVSQLKSTKEYEDYTKAISSKEMVKDLLSDFTSKKAYLTNHHYEKHLKALNALAVRGGVKENLDNFVESIKSSKISDEGKLDLYKRANELAVSEAVASFTATTAQKARVAESLGKESEETETKEEVSTPPVAGQEVPANTGVVGTTENPVASQPGQEVTPPVAPTNQVSPTVTPEETPRFEIGPAESETIEWDVDPIVPGLPEAEVTEPEAEVKDSTIVPEVTPEDFSSNNPTETRNPTNYSIKKFKEKFSAYLHFKNISPSSTLAWLNKQYKELRGVIKTVSNERIRPELNSNKKYDQNTEVKLSVTQNSIEFKSFLDNPEFLEFPISISFNGGEVGNLHTPVWIVDLRDSNGLSFFATQEGRVFLKELISVAQSNTEKKAAAKIESMLNRLLLSKNGIYTANSFRNTVTSTQDDLSQEADLGVISSEFVKNVQFRTQYAENGFKESSSKIKSISAGVVSLNRNKQGKIEMQEGKDALPDPDLKFVIIKDGEAFEGAHTRLNTDDVINDEFHSLNGTLAVVIPLRSSEKGEARNIVYPLYMKKVAPMSKEWKLAKKVIDLFLAKQNDPVLTKVLDDNPTKDSKNLNEFFRQYITFVKFAGDAISNFKINVSFNDDWSVNGSTKSRCVELTIPSVFKKSKYLTTPMELSMTIDKNNISMSNLPKFLEGKRNMDGSQITPEQFLKFTYNDVISLWLQDSYLTANASVNKVDVLNNKRVDIDVFDVNEDQEIVHTGSMPYNEFLKDRFVTEIDGTSQVEGEYIYNDQPVYDLELPVLGKASNKATTKESSPVSTPITTEVNIKAKKADIERRRQEEIDNLFSQTQASTDKQLNTPVQKLSKEEINRNIETAKQQNKDLIEELEKEFKENTDNKASDEVWDKWDKKSDKLDNNLPQGVSFKITDGKVDLFDNQSYRESNFGGNSITQVSVTSLHRQTEKFEVGDRIQVQDGVRALPAEVTKVNENGKILEAKTDDGRTIISKGNIVTTAPINDRLKINAKYDAELAALEKTKPVSDKKADIERRRQEELKNNVTLLNTAEQRRPSGSIGTQGFTEISFINLARFISDKLNLNLPAYDTSSKVSEITQIINFLKNNEAAKQAILEYVKSDPIIADILPDDTYHFKDGNHRANLLNLIGVEQLPIISSEKNKEINAKYDAELATLEGAKPAVAPAPTISIADKKADIENQRLSKLNTPVYSDGKTYQEKINEHQSKIDNLNKVKAKIEKSDNIALDNNFPGHYDIVAKDSNGNSIEIPGIVMGYTELYFKNKGHEIVNLYKLTESDIKFLKETLYREIKEEIEKQQSWIDRDVQSIEAINITYNKKLNDLNNLNTASTESTTPIVDKEEVDRINSAFDFGDESISDSDALQVGDEIVKDQLETISAVTTGKEVSLSKQQEAVEVMALLVKMLYFGQMKGYGKMSNKEQLFDTVYDLLKDFNKGNDLAFILNNYENFKTLAEKELAKIGFVVKNKVDQIAKLEDRNERESSDIETEAGQVLEKYSDSSYQLNPIEGASGRLKAKLGTIRLNESEKLLGKFPKTVNAESLFMEMKRLFADTPNLTWEKVLVTLEDESSKANKSYLSRARNTMQNTWSQQDINEFMTLVNGQKVDFNIILWKNVNGKFTLKSIDSSRVNAETVLQNNWSEKFKTSNLVIKHKGEMLVDIKAVQELYNRYSAIAQPGVKKEDQIDLMVELLNTAGIDITPEELLYISNNLDKYKKATIGNAPVSTDWESAISSTGLLGRLFEPFNIPSNYKDTYEISRLNNKEYLHVDDFHPVKEGNYKVLARYLSKGRENLFTDSFKDVNNNTIFGYGLYYHIKEVINKIKSPGGLVEYKNDPFIADSYLYQKRDLISVKITDGLKNDAKKAGSANKAVSAGELSPREIEMRYIGLIQNQGHETSHVPIPTLSDKSEQSIQISIPRVSVKSDKPGLNKFAKSELVRILDSEIHRIHNFKQSGNAPFDEGYKYFYFFPYANKVLFDELVANKKIDLAKYGIADYSDDMWEYSNGAYVPVSKTLKSAIVQFTVDQLVEQRIQKWEELNLTVLPTQNEGVVKRQLPFDTQWLFKNGFLNIDTVDEKGNITDDMHPGIIEFAALEYEVQSLIVGSGFYQVIAKDPALYFKPIFRGISFEKLTPEQVRANLKATMIEAVKRNAKEVAPGKKPYFQVWDGSNLIRQTHYKSVVIADKRGGTTSDFVNSSPYADAYKKIDNTDAQEYTSLKEHLNVSFALGYLDLESYKKLLKKAYLQEVSDRSVPLPEEAILTQEDFKSLQSLQIQKPVQVVEKVINGKVMITYVKSSSMPLFRQITEGYEIDELTKTIDNNKIDRVAFSTAVKAGSTNIVNLYDPETGKLKAQMIPQESDSIMQLSRDGFYIQQEVPYEEDKDSILTISQMNALITADTEDLTFNFPEFSDKPIKGKQVKALLKRVRSKMFSITRDQIFKKLDVQIKKDPISGKTFVTTKSVDKLREFIIDEAISRDYPANDIYSLATADNKFILSLFFNPSSNKFESLLTSVFSKIIKQKVPGKSFIQTTGADWKPIAKDESHFSTADKNSIVHTSAYDPAKGLQYMRKTDGGYVTQIMLPWDFRDEKGKLLDINQYMVDGKIDFSKLDPSLLQMIGARIPNQGHNSMSAVEVVGFLPPWMGDTVMVPVEFTKQMGADFDVDKLYAYRRHYKVVDGNIIKLPYSAKVETKTQSTEEELEYGYSREDKSDELKELQNRYVDLHWGILTHPEISKKIIEPLDKDDLEQEFKLLGKDEDILGIGTAEFNQRAFIENRAGKKGVAIESLAVVFNSLLQGKGVSLATKEITLGGIVTIPFFIPIKSGSKTVMLTNLGSSAVSYYDEENNGTSQQRTIGAVLQIIQNEAVDNAKKGSLGGTNLNAITFGAANTLAMLSDGKTSVGLDTIIRFFTQESVLQYTEMLSKISDSMESGSFKSKKDALKDLLLKYYGGQAGIIKDESYTIPSAKQLKELRDNAANKTSPEYFKHQYYLLSQFFLLEDLGNSMQKMQRIANLSSKGIGKSFIQTKEYEQIYNEMISGGITSSDNFINFVNTENVISDSEIKDVFEQSVKPALSFSEEHFPYADIAEQFIPFFEEATNGKLNTDRKRALFNQLKSFIYSDEFIHGENAVEERRRLLANDSSENLLKRLALAKETWGKNNYLLKRLSPVMAVKARQYSTIEYNASTEDRLDSENNTLAFIEMFTSQDKEQRDLARDLIVYSLLTNPVQSATNFIKFIPSSVYLDPSVSNVLNLNMTDIRERKFDYESFLYQYMLNNPTSAIKVDGALLERIKAGDSFYLPEYSDGLSNELKLLYTNNLKKKTKTSPIKGFNAAVHPYPYFYSMPGSKSEDTVLYKVTDLGKGKGYAVTKQKVAKQDKITLYTKMRSDVVEQSPVSTVLNTQPLDAGEQKMLENPIPQSYVEQIGLTTDVKGQDYIVKLLEEFSKDTNDPDLAYVAKLLSSNPNLFKDSVISLDFNLKTIGNYNSGKVTINPSIMKVRAGETLERKIRATILHELLHAATVEKYIAWKFNKDTEITFREKILFERLDELRSLAIKAQDQTKIKESLNRIHSFYKKNNNLEKADRLKNDPLLSSLIDESNSMEGQLSPEDIMVYALSDTKEFITMMMTDQDFQRQMNQVIVGNKSIAERFSEWLTEFLAELAKTVGITLNKDHKTVLLESIKVIEELIKDADKMQGVLNTIPTENTIPDLTEEELEALNEEEDYADDDGVTEKLLSNDNQSSIKKMAAQKELEQLYNIIPNELSLEINAAINKFENPLLLYTTKKVDGSNNIFVKSISSALKQGLVSVVVVDTDSVEKTNIINDESLLKDSFVNDVQIYQATFDNGPLVSMAKIFSNSLKKKEFDINTKVVNEVKSLEIKSNIVDIEIKSDIKVETFSENGTRYKFEIEDGVIKSGKYAQGGDFEYKDLNPKKWQDTYNRLKESGLNKVSEPSIKKESISSKKIVIPEGASPDNMVIFEDETSQYLMTNDQQNAYNTVLDFVKNRRENSPNVSEQTFADVQSFDDTFSKQFSGIIPIELYNNFIGIQGFGGTGKTASVKKIMEDLIENNSEKYNNLSVAYVAPTHIAATMLQESLGLDSESTKGVDTIASFLRNDPSNEGDFNINSEMIFKPRPESGYIDSYKYKKPVGAHDVIIVDESSMFSKEDMVNFIARMVTDHKKQEMTKFPIVIFMGDYHQLSPIESDNKYKLGIVSSGVLRNKEKSVVLNQMMRTSDADQKILFTLISTEIDKYLDSIESGKEYKFDYSKILDYLKVSKPNILSVNSSEKNINDVIDDYVNYMLNNDNPDGMFYLHYNKITNPLSKKLTAEIRKRYLKALGLDYTEKIVEGDYVVYNGSVAMEADSVRLPKHLFHKSIVNNIFKEQGNYKPLHLQNEKIPTIFFNNGTFKPKARFKIVQLMEDHLFNFNDTFSSTNLRDYGPELKELLENNFKGDIKVLYNRQNKVRALWTIPSLSVEKQELIYKTNRYGKNVPIGIDFYIKNKENERTVQFQVFFDNKSALDFLLKAIPSYSKSFDKLFAHSYIGSTHSFQGAGVKNTIVGVSDILKYSKEGSLVNQLDVASSLYTAFTRTKSTTTALVSQNTETKAFKGYKGDDEKYENLSDSDALDFSTEIVKDGVQEVFESNPELANAVYEALGFKSKPDIILPIGTSGSGKSTFIKSLPQENLVVIEPDAMRVEFTGNMNDKSKDKEIYEEAANRAVQAIKQGKQVIFDTTNLTKDKRLPFIEAIKAAIPSANIQYKLMELNPELAKQRIKAQLERGENRANVPDSTIDRHAESYKQMLEDIKNEPVSNFEITPQQKQQAQQLYSQYLDTIFPDSQVKDIVYHGTSQEYRTFKGEIYELVEETLPNNTIKNTKTGEIQEFSQAKWENLPLTIGKTFTKPIIKTNMYGKKSNGIWFTNKFNAARTFGGRWLANAYILNIKTPETIDQKGYYIEQSLRSIYNENFKNKDSVVITNVKNYIPEMIVDETSVEIGTNVIVFEPEQIHILGSKQDIKEFKDFVGKTNTVTEEQFNDVLDSLETVEKDCSGKPATIFRAESGFATSSFTPGSKWTLVKDLKGPSHAQGGIDLSINNGKVMYSDGRTKFHAANGLVIKRIYDMRTKVEAQGGELILRNQNGDTIIIPKNRRKEAMKALLKEDHKYIDSIASQLPTAASYADEGSLIPQGNPGGSVLDAQDSNENDSEIPTINPENVSVETSTTKKDSTDLPEVTIKPYEPINDPKKFAEAYYNSQNFERVNRNDPQADFRPRTIKDIAIKNLKNVNIEKVRIDKNGKLKRNNIFRRAYDSLFGTYIDKEAFDKQGLGRHGSYANVFDNSYMKNGIFRKKYKVEELPTVVMNINQIERFAKDGQENTSKKLDNNIFKTQYNSVLSHELDHIARASIYNNNLYGSNLNYNTTGKIEDAYLPEYTTITPKQAKLIHDRNDFTINSDNLPTIKNKEIINRYLESQIGEYAHDEKVNEDHADIMAVKYYLNTLGHDVLTKRYSDEEVYKILLQHEKELPQPVRRYFDNHQNKVLYNQGGQGSINDIASN